MESAKTLPSPAQTLLAIRIQFYDTVLRAWVEFRRDLSSKLLALLPERPPLESALTACDTTLLKREIKILLEWGGPPLKCARCGGCFTGWASEMRIGTSKPKTYDVFLFPACENCKAYLTKIAKARCKLVITAEESLRPGPNVTIPDPDELVVLVTELLSGTDRTRSRELLDLKCRVCGGNTKLKLCSRCRSVAYCSAACQKMDWDNHKRDCGQVASPAAFESKGAD